MPLSSDGFAPGRFSIVLFIIGKCPSCFEDEIPLWNRLAEDARKKGISYLAINCSLHRELILEYQRERMVEFAIIDGGEEFKDFFGGFETHQLLCFVVDSNLTILKAHSSIPKQPELTEEFCRNVLELSLKAV
jgi:thiol-disulfide isomerase/thioredoxin